MPTERREKHSYIHPRRGYSTYFLRLILNYSQQRLFGFINIVEVKEILLIFHLSSWNIRKFCRRKTRPIFRNWEICSILHFNFKFIALRIGNKAPKLLLILLLSCLTFGVRKILVLVLKIKSIILEIFD